MTSARWARLAPAFYIWVHFAAVACETKTWNELILIRIPVGKDVMVHLSYAPEFSILD